MSNTEYKSAKDAMEDIMNDGGIMDDIMDDIMNDTSNIEAIIYKDIYYIEEPANEPINSDLIKLITGIATSDELGNIIDNLSPSNDLCVSALKK